MARALIVGKMRYRKNFHTINYTECFWSEPPGPCIHCRCYYGHIVSHSFGSHIIVIQIIYRFRAHIFVSTIGQRRIIHYHILKVFHHQIKLKNSVPQTHSVHSLVAIERMLWFNWLRFVVVDECSLHPGLMIVQVPQSLPFSFLNTSRRF